MVPQFNLKLIMEDGVKEWDQDNRYISRNFRDVSAWRSYWTMDLPTYRVTATCSTARTITIASTPYEPIEQQTDTVVGRPGDRVYVNPAANRNRPVVQRRIV